ncbi:MAG: hypothetical protein NW201_00775 [Gemmatimonadales bacterium]|nr:hypothetical protein [Gemmatimonadales bacterium]
MSLPTPSVAQVRQLLFAAGLATVAACSDANDPGATTGALTGAIRLLDEDNPPPTGGHVRVFRSVAEFEEQLTSTITAPMTRESGTWRFALRNLPPGTYYLKACWSFGCADVRTGGAPRPFTVQAGRTTDMSAAL